MSKRLMRSIAPVLLCAAPLAVTLLSTPAQAATPPSVTSHDPGPKSEKPDPAWKERYERIHEPREKSEQRELARERRQGGR
ncbi:MAG: hypothetical protein ACRDP3_09030 [Streptomyces sp.]|uniref:hypothetical protein n=1 Tax=Streptomyces sp. TaxID=1931 RepID=UPI003D6BD7A0